MDYNDLNSFLRNKFDSKVIKLSFDGGFSCPNRENGKKGCIFCTGSNEFAGNKFKTLKEQYDDQVKIMIKKTPNAKYIAYFGSFTNTYDKLENLKKRYEEVLTFPNIIGLDIATRCDSISNECLDYLIDLNKRTFLTIELGLQSMHNETLNYINRGHDLKSFEKCVKKLKANNINVVVHIINGLPNENEEMMLENINYLNKLDIDGIKFHNLCVLKNTPLEIIYKNNKFHILDEDEYINILLKQIKLLKPSIVIYRLKADPKKEDLIAPMWPSNKIEFLNKVHKIMKNSKICQGNDYNFTK